MSRESPTSSGRRTISERWSKLVDAVEATALARKHDPDLCGVELGRFELLEWLGGGGMGVVFRARDSKLGREVALKLWKLPRGEAEAAVLHEAQCLARLSHPNVVAMYDTGKVGDDVFLTMEFVEGMDGRTWVCSFLLDWMQILDFYIPAARGLEAAHRAGLEHGDFKPENVLLGRDQRVRVADFGVARALREHANPNHAPLGTDDSGGLGTLGYMAPERLEGRRGDARSDQFSLCVTLWECLYGARPFGGLTPVALLESIERGEPAIGEALPGIPRRLRRVIERGLSVEPGERWPDMERLIAELVAIRRRPTRRRRQWRVAAVVAGAAIASSVITMLLVAPDAPRENSEINGISPESTTTLLMGADVPTGDEGDADLVSRVAAKVDEGDLGGAYEIWGEAQNIAWTTDTTIEAESLEIAHLFMGEANRLEAENLDRAISAAEYGSLAASYASIHFPNRSPQAEQITDLRRELSRIKSEFTRLLVDYERLLATESVAICPCHGAHDECPSEPLVEANQHRCLMEVLADHEDQVTRYVECAAPIIDEYNACLDGAGCQPDISSICSASKLRDLSACPSLIPALDRAIAGCTR